MAIGNGELMQEGKKGGVSMEKSKAGTKKEVPTAYHILTKIQ